MYPDLAPPSGDPDHYGIITQTKLSNAYSRGSPEHLQVAMVDAFTKFTKQVRKVEQALFEFGNASKQLDGSENSVASANSVKTALANLRQTVHENVDTLCPDKVQPPTLDDDRDLSSVMGELKRLAAAFAQLLASISMLSQFQDMEIQTVFESAAGDLEYWAKCLHLYDDRFEEMSIRRYVNDLTLEITSHLDLVVESLSYFTTTAIPMVAIAQHHDPVNIQNLTTIATFFSAVTATTLQFSYEAPHDTITHFVNGCWFSSLVFSVASTVNLLLGALLLRVLYRTPVRVPQGIYLWLYGSPLAFLVVAVACFSAGLVAFAYASNQHHIVSVITTAFSAFTYVGIVVVTSWFIIARFTFVRRRTRSKLSKLQNSIPQSVSTTPRWPLLQAVASRILTWSSRRHLAAPADLEAEVPMDSDEKRSINPEPLDSRERNLVGMVVNRWTSLVKAKGSSPVRNSIPEGLKYSKSFLAIPKNRIMGFGESTSKLQSISFEHAGGTGKVRIRDAKFSPDGKLLAVCGGEQSSSLWRIKGPIDQMAAEEPRILSHPQGLADELSWSPNGSFLITKLKRAIVIWPMDGRSKIEVNRERRVKSVSWLPEGTAFLSLEENTVVKLNLSGTILDTFNFDSLSLRSIAVCMQPDTPWLVAVAISKTPLAGRKPSKEELYHRRLILYDMSTKEIRAQVPMFHDVREVSMAESDRHILVKFKGGMPPQLWEIEAGKVENGAIPRTAHLVLSTVYATKNSSISSRFGCFGGPPHDPFIVCTEEDAGISVFHRDTGNLRYSIPWHADMDERRCLTCRPGDQDQVVIAAGSDEGIRLWVAAPQYVNRPKLQPSSRLKSSASKVLNSLHSGLRS